MYIMACDERGSIYRFSKTQSWVYGGFIFNSSDKKKIIKQWNAIKKELCGSDEKELKWRHFFLKNNFNPLLEDINLQESLFWALDQLFLNKYVVTPISTRVPKDRASDVCYKKTSRGNQVLDYEVLSVSIYGQFALFLKIMNSCGEMWFDQLGSEKEQERKQKDWVTLRNNNPNLEFKKMSQKIKTNIKFCNSKKEPIIQIADFISGAIWAASEGDEKYLLHKFQDYFPEWWSKINLFSIT